jgi:hypothetical protein
MAEMLNHGWRLILTPDSIIHANRQLPPGWRYALDNGAWGCYQRGAPFDSLAFIELVGRYGLGADWIVAPDIVAGGLASLELSVAWLERLPGRRLIAVQDGMVPSDVEPYIRESVGIFLGGSTAWKISTMRDWGKLARATACYFHIARVNTGRRIRLCQDAGAHSFDGTSPSRFAVTTPKLTAHVRQGHLFGGFNV